MPIVFISSSIIHGDRRDSAMFSAHSHKGSLFAVRRTPGYCSFPISTRDHVNEMYWMCARASRAYYIRPYIIHACGKSRFLLARVPAKFPWKLQCVWLRLASACVVDIEWGSRSVSLLFTLTRFSARAAWQKKLKTVRAVYTCACIYYSFVHPFQQSAGSTLLLSSRQRLCKRHRAPSPQRLHAHCSHWKDVFYVARRKHVLLFPLLLLLHGTCDICAIAWIRWNRTKLRVVAIVFHPKPEATQRTSLPDHNLACVFASIIRTRCASRLRYFNLSKLWLCSLKTQ